MVVALPRAWVAWTVKGGELVTSLGVGCLETVTRATCDECCTAWLLLSYAGFNNGDVGIKRGCFWSSQTRKWGCNGGVIGLLSCRQGEGCESDPLHDDWFAVSARRCVGNADAKYDFRGAK